MPWFPEEKTEAQREGNFGARMLPDYPGCSLPCSVLGPSVKEGGKRPRGWAVTRSTGFELTENVGMGGDDSERGSGEKPKIWERTETRARTRWRPGEGIGQRSGVRGGQVINTSERGDPGAAVRF